MAEMIKSNTEALEKVLVGLAFLREGLHERKSEASGRLEPNIRAMESELAQSTDRLETVRDELMEIEEIDDEEGDYDDISGDLEHEAENLEESIRELNSSIHKGHNLLVRIQSLEDRMRKTVETEIPEAEDFITRKLEALSTFQNHNPGFMLTPKNCNTTTTLISPPVRATASVKPPATIDLLSIRLPERFTWLPLAETIKGEGLRREDLHFKNASMEQFQKLLQQLHAEVLPVLRRSKDPATVRAVLEDEDLKSKRHGADSRTNIFDVFFGNDSVTVDKNGGQLLNGRHRIWIAAQLGWTHLPVKKP